MRIKVQNFNDVAVAELQGDLAGEVSESLEDTASKAIAEDLKGIVIDMSHVGFIDSLCLEQLLHLREHCCRNNCQLKIAGLNETCEKIFHLTRLEKQLDIYEELAEAVKSFV